MMGLWHLNNTHTHAHTMPTLTPTHTTFGPKYTLNNIAYKCAIVIFPVDLFTGPVMAVDFGVFFMFIRMLFVEWE